MKITENLIPHIEKAVGFTLRDHQINYLLDKGPLASGRNTGKTVAYCIKLALSDGVPLDMERPFEFSDYGDGSRSYAYKFFRNEFMKYRGMLKDYGFPVREVKL